jgi:hypothetical protein
MFQRLLLKFPTVILALRNRSGARRRASGVALWYYS